MSPLSNILGKINPLDKNNSVNEEFCLALLINEKKVQSAIWSLSEPARQPIYGEAESWGNDSAEELIVAADASISSAINKMPFAVGLQPTKVVLGLPEYWVSGNTVNPQRGQILQRVCHKLTLKSLGFVITPDAVSLFLKKEEGGMPSLILVNLGEADIVVSLINQGKFLGSKIVGRSENLSFDLEEGLLRFDHQEVMPNRIFLVKDGDLSGGIEELKQNLMAHPWVSSDKKLNFLQLPKIEVAENDFEIRAVVVAGKHELGIEFKKEAPPVEEVKVQEVLSPVIEEKSEEVAAAVVENEPGEENQPVFEEEIEGNFGFIKDEDILTHQNLVLPEKETAPFVDQPAIETEVVPEVASPAAIKTALVEKESKPSFFKGLPAKIAALFSRIKPFPGLRAERPQFQFAFNKAYVYVLAAVFLLLGGTFLGFYKLAKAEVKVYVQPQKVQSEFDFSVSSKVSSVDSEKMIIPGREVSVDVSGSKTTTVNGKKLVGDKAKGEVMIYNGSDKVKTLAKGTTIKASNNLKFVLDQEVKVASKTADLNSFPPVEKWGEAKVSVSAAAIGAEYNLAANSTLSLEGTTTILIKNPSAFSGGSSREIQAVSKEDRDNLRKDLLEELTKKAEEEINNKISPKDSLISGSFKLTGSVDKFNHEVDDEADSLTLEETATFTASYIQESDINILADKSLIPLVPSGYQKTPQKEQSSFSDSDKVKGAYIAKVSGEFMPEIDLSGLPKSLKAKTITQAEKILNNMGKFSSADFSIKPKIFSVFKFLPLTEKNITVIVESL